MKENLISDKSLIYQWNFNDNMSVVDNPRVKATVNGNPTFKDGVATFNGSTDYYILKSLINLGTKYSIEIKFKQNSTASELVLLGGDSNNKLSIGTTTVIHKATTNITAAYTPNTTSYNTFCFTRNGVNSVFYMNGVSIGTSAASGSSNFVFNIIGALADFTLKFNGKIEYIKVWNRQLTPSEVRNNYAGKTYRALPYKATTLFHINSDNGVIRDLTGKTNPVATNVTLSKIGSNINVMKFNGSSGNINLGTQALTGDITFIGWVNNANKGETNEGRIIDNGNFVIRHSTTNKYYVLTRNNSTNAISANNAVKESITTFICVTSTSTGITNFYIGDKNNPPVLSGTANQNAGTPVAGSICYLGNRAADDRTMNGWLNDVRLDQSILTLDEITQYWSSTKQKYQ